MRDSGALTELLLTRLKKVEVPKNYASRLLTARAFWTSRIGTLES